MLLLNVYVVKDEKVGYNFNTSYVVIKPVPGLTRM